MMHDRRNDYLKRRQDRRRGRGRDYRNPYGSRGGYVDHRNPYGSRGGYVDSRRGNDYSMDYRNYDSEHNRGNVSRGDINNRDSRNDYHRQQYGESSRPHEFEIYGVGGMRPRDYNDYNSDYRRDYNSDYRRDYNMDSRRDYDMRRDYNMDYRRDYGMDDMNDYGSGDMEKEYEEELEKWIEKLKRKEIIKVPKEQVLQQAKNMGVKFDEYDEKEFYATYLMVMSDYPSISGEYNIYIKMAKDWLEDDDIALSPSEKLCKYLYTIVLGEE